MILEMHDRIRELRKKHLHLSQTEFGERLGVSRSVIKNIELDALARPDQKLSLIKLMCKEFSVNEDWLLNGTEPMFIEPDTFSLDQFVRERGGTDLEIEIVKAYFELDKDARLAAVNYFLDRITAARERAAKEEQNAEPEQTAVGIPKATAEEMTPEELHAALDREIQDEKERQERLQVSQNTGSSSAKLA